MIFKPLQVTAHLATPIAVNNNWTPCLDNLLEYLWIDSKNLLSPHPTKNLIKADLPVRKDYVLGQEFWACSSPFYILKSESVDRYRKRWDNQEGYVNWGKKKAKVDTSQGTTKSWDVPLRLINTSRVDWFLVGNINGVSNLLKSCTHIGGKRSQGKGQVFNWEIKPVNEDWSLYKNHKLTRPFPQEFVDNLDGYTLLKWGWNTVNWLPENFVLCAMPNNIVYEQSIQS